MISREVAGSMYDRFYGRSFNSSGDERYVLLDLESGGSTDLEPTPLSYSGIVREMVDDAKRGRKILLHKSPGFRELTGEKVYFVPFDMRTQKMLEDMVNGVMDGSLAKGTRI